jgi:glutamyl-tRNA synthetase
MTHPVVTRFAPSPTGFLHIGGGRTALFNWLYARHTGGTFRLRIEDTDRERSTEAATRAIIDGLGWLGLDWDGEIVHQHKRQQRHAQIAREMLAQGRAYRCFLTPAELEAMQKAIQDERALARQEKRPPRGPQTIQSPWRDRDPNDAPKGAPFAIRLKAPREGDTVIEDRVQGRVVFANTSLDDLVILRSDGTPTYNLSVVVDDHDMAVTHVIRGDDHLSNTPKQAQIYDAMGWPRPVFAHVPLIHNPEGKKLSKRHGAAGIEEYRAMGYLPVAMRNYLVRLGWSHGDDEIISTEQLIEWFDIDAIGQSPARLDFDKLNSISGHYIRQCPNDELVARVRSMYAEIRAAKPTLPAIDGDADWQRFAAAVPLLKERAKTLVELVQGAGFVFAKRPLVLDDAANKQLTPETRTQLSAIAKALAGETDWSGPKLEAVVRTYAEMSGLKLGKVAQPLRAALTGSTVSPPIFDVLAVLGRAESLARIADQAA